MLEAPGFGEIPISFSSSPSIKSTIELCIRKAGKVTQALHKAKRGAVVGLRGPFGTCFPMERMKGSNILLIAGGLGLAPLRAPISFVIENRADFQNVYILYGARDPSQLLFDYQYEQWRRIDDIVLEVIVEQPDKWWMGPVGLITRLLDGVKVPPDETYAIVCGPPVMFKFVCNRLGEMGIPMQWMFVSLERRMHCGIGKCCRCNIGSTYTCIDGPVFDFWTVMNLKEAILKYLGMEIEKPRIAIFDFTSCEGCELQLVNLGEKLPDLFRAVEIVDFRVASSAVPESPGDCDIAFVEGAATRYDEIERLKRIREKAKVLVALGSCACFGGVNRLKNETDLKSANREVYGDRPKETLWVKSAGEIVKMDLEIPGCPVFLPETARILQHLILGVPFAFPVYPVCLDCKQRFSTCLMEQGQLCLGPITRGGCEAPCPASGLGCFGCRGPAADPNYPSFFSVALDRGFSERRIKETMNFFGGFREVRFG